MTDNFPVHGVDVSRWQKDIDWAMALSQGISFAFIKATEGKSILDSQYDRNMEETGALSIPRGIYHFFRPDQAKTDWRDQADNFVVSASKYSFELDIVLDIERDGGLSKRDLNNVLEKWVGRVEESTNRLVMIYTSPGFWDRFMPATDWARYRKLWNASWTTAANPTIPDEWDKPGWVFWQWSCKNQLGHEYGVATKSIDLDRFIGTREDFRTMYNLSSLPVPVEGAIMYEVLLPSVHLFSAPGVASPIVGNLQQGDVIQLNDVYGTDEVWIKTNTGEWLLFAYNGNQLLRKV